jgi:hypothetical protein
MFNENGDQNGLKRLGPRCINAGLDMKPCFFEEPIEKLLVLFSQPSSKLSPLLDFLLQNLTKRKDRSSHYSFSGVRHTPCRVYGYPEPHMV